MSVSRFERDYEEGLTRISVRSSRDHYLVRTGSGPAVRVWRKGPDLECECGRKACSHIASLRMCGFVEDVRDLPRAA
jgi:hypothetical protein